MLAVLMDFKLMCCKVGNLALTDGVTVGFCAVFITYACVRAAVVA